MSSHCEHMKKVKCAPSSTPPSVEDQRWVPPLVDADWHAFCRAIFQGIEGQEWEAMFHHNKDLHSAVKSKKLGKIERPKCCGP